jgi:uncharacterized protein
MTNFPEVGPRQRVISLVVYCAALLVIQYWIVEQHLPPSTIKGLWFYAGIASLLLGSRLLNPYFTPPGDAAVNAFVSAVAILAAWEAARERSMALGALHWTGAYCLLVFTATILSLLLRPPHGAPVPSWLVVVDRVGRALGAPNVIYTVVIIAAVWVFHRSEPLQVFSILTATLVIVAFAPVDRLLAFYSWVDNLNFRAPPEGIIGTIAAHQSPGIVLIRQNDGETVSRGSPLLVCDAGGPHMLGVALNYVGRDEGNLLRVLTVPIPNQLTKRTDAVAAALGTGVATHLSLTLDEMAMIPDAHPASILRRVSQLCGIVDQDTSLDFLQFEVIEDRELAEGCLVETNISGVAVLYQVMEGLTREDIVQQKNKYGYARGKARKIGCWNSNDETFKPVKWLPNMNGAIFLKVAENFVPSYKSVGHFPRTSYGVGLDISQAVTHNTAILGILGIGKSFLAIELVERMISANGVKVICLDLTNQYADHLMPFLDPVYEEAQIAALRQVEGRGAPHQNKEQGGTRSAFKERMKQQLAEFLDDNNERYLRIYNPARFDVWQQVGGLFQGNAAMASLTPCEITAIITEAALDIAQEKGMKDYADICLVFEEAHSIVPEWNSVASDGDRAATAATARAILQGRKYGLGCLLITQRTANVTKTILNQCNTVFAMRTFDDTGKDFLSNYIGGDYARMLPTMEARHAVLFGKASACENPVLLRLNDRDAFVAAFRAAFPPDALPPMDDGNNGAE